LRDTVVFTDFDGTYIKGDSYFRSLLFFPGYGKFFKILPDLIFTVIEYYLKFITRNEAKRRTFELVFRGVDTRLIDEKLDDFINQLHIFPKVKKKIDSFRKMGCKIVIVTASPDIYMDYISEKLGFDGCICTETERRTVYSQADLKERTVTFPKKRSG